VKILPSCPTCKSHHPLPGSNANCVIGIEHVITENLADGRPTLPIGEADDIVWALAMPLADGRTQWRRTHLSQTLFVRWASRPNP
jgi:hypothetical protein